MAIYVLRLSSPNPNGHPTKVQLVGPFPNEVRAHDWGSKLLSHGNTLRVTIVDLQEPVVEVKEGWGLW